MPKIKEIFNSCVASICRSLIWLLGKQPLKVHYFWGRAISWLLRSVFHYREKVIYTNLTWAFPDLKYWQREKIARRFYDHLGEIIAEFFYFGGSSSKRLHSGRLVEMTNPEEVEALMDKGRAVMILTSHCGNWEILGGIPYYSYDGKPSPLQKDNIFVVYKKLSSDISDKIFRSNRCQPVPGYEGCVESHRLPREIVRHKNDRCAFLVNNDQYPSHAFVDVGTFLNKPTRAFVATAEIAHKLSLPVVFMKMDNDRTGHYNMTFQTICEDGSTLSSADIVKKYMSLLEAQILANPANWLWSHKRWK